VKLLIFLSLSEILLTSNLLVTDQVVAAVGFDGGLWAGGLWGYFQSIGVYPDQFHKYLTRRDLAIW
jgi:hypothetical protein